MYGTFGPTIRIELALDSTATMEYLDLAPLVVTKKCIKMLSNNMRIIRMSVYAADVEFIGPKSFAARPQVNMNSLVVCGRVHNAQNVNFWEKRMRSFVVINDAQPASMIPAAFARM